MELVAISNRTLSEAERAYRQAGIDSVKRVESVGQLKEAIAQNQYAITDDAMLLCQAGGIDAVIEVTGTIEFGAQVALKAIEYGKHVILMNAELDATLGPILAKVISATQLQCSEFGFTRGGISISVWCRILSVTRFEIKSESLPARFKGSLLVMRNKSTVFRQWWSITC